MQNRITRGLIKVVLTSILSLVLVSCAQPAQKEGVWYTHDGKPYAPTLATDYNQQGHREEITEIIDTAMNLNGRMHIVGSSLNGYSVWGYFEGNTIKGTFGQTSQFDDLSNLRTPVEMMDPLIEIDTSNRPHILFINNERLCHCYIEGKRWFSTDGEPVNDENDISKSYITNCMKNEMRINYDIRSC